MGDPTDNRARIIHLTPRGRRLHATAVDIHAEIEQQWEQRVGRQRYERLRQTLVQLMGPDQNR